MNLCKKKKTMKFIFTAILALAGITAVSKAQNVPSYLPSNGLVGWWPFNGNANDESGNGNNGTVNGATLTSDRFGNANAAYHFSNNGNVQNIVTNYAGILSQNDRSISVWYLQESISPTESQALCGYGGGSLATAFSSTTLNGRIGLDVNNSRRHYSLSTPSQWNHAVLVYQSGNSISTVKVYLNGVLQTNAALTFGNQTTPLNTSSGANFTVNAASLPFMFFGKIDDIGFWNRALTQQEITAIYNSQTCSASITPAGPTNLCSGQSLTLTASGSSGLQSCTSSGLPSNLQNGLVGYWPFCGNANDASGNGNNGTVNGATLTSDRFGNANSAYSFNGSNNWIEVISTPALSLPNSFTISTWLYRNNSNLMAAVTKERTPGGWGYYLLGGDAVGINNGPPPPASAPTCNKGGSVSNVSVQNTWYNLTATWNGLNLILFVNGSQVLILDGNLTDCGGSLLNSLQKLYFGKDNVSYNPFSGKIDDIAIYNRALSTAEIQQLYGLGSTQYLWSTGATTPSISVSPTQTTTYTVTVTENGQTCTASSTVNVSTPTATISANGPTSFCTGGSVTLTANSGSSYLWSNGATSQSITVNQAGSYSVTVTSNGCSATSSPTVVTITQTANPTVSANGPITFCSGGSVTLNSSTGSSYLWSNGATSQSITVNQSGTYSVTTNTNGCSGSSAPITVTVNQPPLASISSSGPTTICQGSSVALNANTGAGLTYQWQLNGNNIAGASAASYTANAAGSYTVVVTNSNGCSATSSATSVTVSASPTVSITPSGPTTFCAGGSVTLSASGASTYQWSNGSNSSSITVSQSGNYTVTGFSNGCSGNASPVGVTVFNNPSVSAGGLPPYTNVNASPLSLTANPSGGIFSGFGVNGNQFYPSQAGLGTATVFYTYTDGNGCSNSTFQQTIVYDTLSQACSTFDTLYINTVITGAIAPNNTSTITIYPNPANTDLVIHNSNFGIMGSYSVRITNTLGQTVFLSQVNQQQFVIALSTLGGAGTYYFALLDGQGNVVETKVIVVQ